MRGKSTPLITVCMPIYNSAPYLAEAIESVLAQSCTDFELLITDDGSTDGTAEIAARYARDDHRIVLRVNPSNLGMVRNWNDCMERASGSYIKFLFGDDVLAPDSLARMAEILGRDAGVSLVASGRTVIDESSAPIEEWIHFGTGTFAGPAVVRRCLLEQENLVGEPSAVMFRTCDAVRGFDASYRHLADLEMWFHLLEKGRLAYLGEPLCCFRRHSDQQTRKNEGELVNFAEMFALTARYLQKPYVGFGRWGAHWFMFQRYYGLWKKFRHHRSLSPLAHDIIDRQYGKKRFYATMALYKLYNPCCKLFRCTVKVAGALPPAGYVLPGVRPVRTLAIFDDLFPHRLSAFRITEYNELLRHFEDAAVYSTAASFPLVQESRDFEAVCGEHAELYPDLRGKVFPFNARRKLSARLGYLMFLNNAHHFLAYLEACRLPFVLELYPGGGFHLNDRESDRKLRQVLSSPLLRRVIVTQQISRDYLVEAMGYPAEKIDYIYGGVFLHRDLISAGTPRQRYGLGKSSLDVCFVAHKYMPQGRDKGYDVFIETAHLLAVSHPCTRFHVVGPFGPGDLDVSALGDRLTFYGTRTTEFFPGFYAGMDLILSPNVPFVLRPGAFDGFPTGACIEAMLCGVALFCCDELKLNPFCDGVELVVVPHDPIETAGIIGRYCREPELLHRLAAAGQQRARAVFSRRSQIEPRLAVLSEALKGCKK